MTRPCVIVDPSFRSMREIFSDETRRRLESTFELVWAADDPMPTEVLRRHRNDAIAYVHGEWRHGPEVVAEFGPQFRGLLEVAGGHEHTGLDYAAALARGIQVGSCAPAFGPEVAEHGLALALAAVRGVPAADRAMRSGSERWLHDGNALNRTLFGTTIGFVGCGSLSVYLQRLLEPFGVELLGYDPPMGSQLLADRGIADVPLEKMFDTADVIFILAAPSSSTIGMIDRWLLERLNEDQTIVILSRGSLVDFDALAELVECNRFGVATDVYPVEPLAADHPIRSADRAVLTPHLAGALPSALHRIGDMVADDLDALADGRSPERMQYLTPDNLNRFLQAQAD